MKNINTRVNEDIFYEVQTVAWFLDVSRSNLVRDMIEYFSEKGTIQVGNQEYPYQHVVELAFRKLTEQNMQPQDLVVLKKSDTELPVLNSKIQELAKEHVKSIKTSWLLEQETLLED